MQIFSNPNYDVLKKRKVWYIISAIVILIGAISMILSGGLKYSIDFSGGLSLEIAPKADSNGNRLTVAQIRDALTKENITDAIIQESTTDFGEQVFLIKTKSEEMIGDKIKNILREQYPEHISMLDAELVRSQEEVGPRAGADLRGQAVRAVLIALVCVLVYIWIRFRFTWGIMAAIALFHDVIIALGILSLCNMEIGMTILAALLTIVGYSINNTIVIFDRIRENLKLYRKEGDYAIINRSINETLSRTVLTSFTTLLANVALLIWGGPVIRGFAFTFTIGILVGTFSSLCISTGLIFDTILAFKKKS